MNQLKKAVFVGTILSEFGLKNNSGISPAASQWSTGLIKSLQNYDIKTFSLSHVWNRAFPFGKLVPGNQKDLSKLFDSSLNKYINVKGIRNTTLTYSLISSYNKLIKRGFDVDFVLFYNAYPYNLKVARYIAQNYPNVKLILLVLDYPDPEADKWATFNKECSVFDGYVFLSWWAYKNAPVYNKIHLDAGWEGEKIKTDISSNVKNKIFVYAGKMESYGGIERIINSIENMPSELDDITFEFYGKGSSRKLIELSNRDERVKLKGFVSELDLEKAFQKATAFLSPLDLSIEDNRMVFPSKIMNYLRYKKPIIASKSAGIGKEYEGVLFFVSENGSDSWGNMILKIASYEESDFKIVAEKSRVLLQQKTWDNQVGKLLDFINKI